MSTLHLGPDLTHMTIYMVGIKGTGMAALAEILTSRGATVSGSDVPEEFYTDSILRAAGIPYTEGFSAKNLPEIVDLVVYSAAYDPHAHPELTRARQRSVPLLQYNEALGELSRGIFSVGVSGVHGKTTTTALIAAIAQQLQLPVTVLAGSALANVGDRSTLILGDEAFIAETCEYRRHFLQFHPDIVLITGVEADHLDYFKDSKDITSAFLEYGRLVSDGGHVIYCADDSGAAHVANQLCSEREDLRLIPYGTTCSAGMVVSGIAMSPGNVSFELNGHPFALSVPGTHNALNAAGALVVIQTLLRLGVGADNNDHAAHNNYKRAADASKVVPGAAKAIREFRGTRRRAETVGEANGIVFLDDYGHHPTAIETTLVGFRAFYPNRRIVLSFMSHTFSRTTSLRAELARSLLAADILILHDIYASAREENPGGVDGTILVDAVKALDADREIHYVPAPDDAVSLVKEILTPGDLFVTMGAGDNWRLGRLVLTSLTSTERAHG